MERDLKMWLKNLDINRQRIAAGYTQGPWYNESISRSFMSHFHNIPVGHFRKVRDTHAHRR